MNAEQALNLLLQAAQLAPLPAQAHQQCLEAFQFLQATLNPPVRLPDVTE